MKPGDRIQEKEHLSQYAQVSTLVYHMLSVAAAGGLDEHRTKQIYSEILEAYSTLRGDAFWLFRDEIISVLVATDEQIEAKEIRPPSWN